MHEYTHLDLFRSVVDYTETRLDRGRIQDPIEMITLLRLVTLELRARSWTDADAADAEACARRAEELAGRIAERHDLNLQDGLEEAVLHWIGTRGARRYWSRLPLL